MKKIITSKNAPSPIGPYNQAVIANGFMYISGQVGMNPKTGKIIKDSISEETEQVMKNLSSILNEASITFENVVKTTIFLSDMNDFSLVNEVYGKYFDEDTAPARETVQVSKLPLGVNVEISMIALL
jgi:2-iminobutanoate/2-iminopropanoate deaminase